MSKIYLHIGIEKTGSSSIQDFITLIKDKIFSNEKAYTEELFKYPNKMELAAVSTPP
jgi:hypothetical protein